MEIQHSETETKGGFYFEENGEKIAEITYSKAGPERIIVDHTQVDDTKRGEGFGKKLVHHLVSFARKNDLKVLPLCPYANSVIRQDPELQDVL